MPEGVEPPLKFEDIVDARTYDKMRPPRPGGENKIRKWRNVGIVPTFKMHNVGTVPTSKMHNVGTVPTFKMYNIGTVPMFRMHNIFFLARATLLYKSLFFSSVRL